LNVCTVRAFVESRDEFSAVPTVEGPEGKNILRDCPRDAERLSCKCEQQYKRKKE